MPGLQLARRCAPGSVPASGPLWSSSYWCPATEKTLLIHDGLAKRSSWCRVQRLSRAAEQVTCKVVASVPIFSEMSAVRPSPPIPLALPLSRPGARRASRPRGLCPRVLSNESDPLDVSIYIWRYSAVRAGATVNRINQHTGLILTFSTLDASVRAVEEALCRLWLSSPCRQKAIRPARPFQPACPPPQPAIVVSGAPSG